MSESKNYLIHFEPPQDISNKIQKIYQEVSSNYENKYNSIVDGIWKSHLMVYLSPMPVANEEVIKRVTEEVSRTIKPFKIELCGFTAGSDGYIFVELDTGAQNKLTEIRNFLIPKLLPLRDNSIKQKYLDKWDQFNEEEKIRIKTTGLPYVYKPHFTISHVEEKNVKQVLNMISALSLEGTSFEANHLQILTFYEGENKIISKFSLG